MCGIAGVIASGRRRDAAELRALARSMSDALEHRGPDGGGVWADSGSGVALGHRRLAVIDLSTSGHQPMVSSCGRFVLTYNGEIYNHHEVARDLAAGGRLLRGRSDTEALVEALAAWGLDETLTRLNGMFAFAAWDTRARELTLARDRMGEKPLYYGYAGNDFVFGSELKALRRHPRFDPIVDRASLVSYLRFRHIPAPRTILRHASKLEAGHVLRVAHDPTGDRVALRSSAYWSLPKVAADGIRRRKTRDDDATVDEADDRLRRAVGLRMEADVGLGSFLSGGIDSTVVTALMQAQSNEPVRTFTVGYDDPAWDESASASRIAKGLGTDHTEMRVTPDAARAVIPSLARIYDEPFGDSSQVPSVLVSSLTRRHVTVALSGDGGDELFGGYNRYVWAPRLLATSARLPRLARVGSGRALGSLTPAQWDAAYRGLEGVLPHRWRQRMPGDKIAKLARALRSGTPAELYLDLVSHWKRPAELVVGGDEHEGPPLPGAGLGVVDAMTLADMASYLPGDILTKVDRASMAASLEARAPLLDHTLVEWSWTLPLEAKLRGGQGKWLLRRVLERYVPPALWDRPKMGFGVPIGDWLRGSLRTWAEDLLEPDRLESEGFLRPDPVRKVWAEHLSGRSNRQYELWDVLMFQSWLEHWGGS